MTETIFDIKNSKAAIFVVDEFFDETGKDRLPVMLSATIVDNSGRTLSGQTIEAFFVSVKHAKTFTVGIISSPELCVAHQARRRPYLEMKAVLDADAAKWFAGARPARRR